MTRTRLPQAAALGFASRRRNNAPPKIHCHFWLVIARKVNVYRREPQRGTVDATLLPLTIDADRAVFFSHDRICLHPGPSMLDHNKSRTCHTSLRAIDDSHATKCQGDVRATTYRNTLQPDMSDAFTLDYVMFFCKKFDTTMHTFFTNGRAADYMIAAAIKDSSKAIELTATILPVALPVWPALFDRRSAVGAVVESSTTTVRFAGIADRGVHWPLLTLDSGVHHTVVEDEAGPATPGAKVMLDVAEPLAAIKLLSVFLGFLSFVFLPPLEVRSSIVLSAVVASSDSTFSTFLFFVGFFDAVAEAPSASTADTSSSASAEVSSEALLDGLALRSWKVARLTGAAVTVYV